MTGTNNRSNMPVFEAGSLDDMIEEALEISDKHETGATVEVAEEYENEWIPEEWVFMINGYRGQGKSAEVANIGLFYICVDDHKIPIYTNLDYAIERLKAEGYTNLPHALDWEAVITFQIEQPLGALYQIDEVDGYLDKLRTSTNQNILATKTVEQIRKHHHKFLLSCQFGHYLPYGMLDQVDIMIQAQDLFFSRAGRERGLHKGEKFLYICYDKSGLFTGGRRQPWAFITHAKKVWPYYKTDKIHDSTQLFKKYEVEQDNKKAIQTEEQISRLMETAKLIHSLPIMGFIKKNEEALNIDDNGTHLIFTKANMEKLLAKHKGKAAKDLDHSYKMLAELAKSGGAIKILKGNKIAIMKLPEYYEEQELMESWGPESLAYEQPLE